jgi:hypothetical protein
MACFAWEYTEMLRLSRELVEHSLPIKEGFMTEIIGKIKEEVDRLLKAKFIQPSRYAEWVSNIVPMEKKKTGKTEFASTFGI